jgi:beta-lactamase superfamily II metal-dependent hydrolase
VAAAPSHGRRSASVAVPAGAADATGESLLAAVHPAVAVISVGADNTYGQPSPQVLERLKDSLVYRTDLNGRVKLSTDGERLWVEVERAPTATPAASAARSW